ncbi:hypothetical protein RBI94_02125 [Pseudomonas putida]|uniref:hypothetical protein n=1 Tax=Pseudomonas putida TaxID=303 RepID=UPI0027C98E79|nr:hypothetical protein [Pseudomonas putida]MDQ2482818.1 hypothetical protein [Pseudomonas putida]
MTDISALEGYAGMLSEAAAQAKAASAKQEQYVEGGAWQDVETEGGLVPALAKQARLAGEKIDSALTDVAAQMAGAMVFATTAAGLAAVPPNGFFSVPSSSSDEYLVLYKKISGAAVEQNRYPNSKAVAQAELAVAASLTTNDLTFVSGWASEANNGGVITRRYGRPCGISVPQGSTGTLTYLTVMFPTANVDVTSLVGSTVQAVITGRYTGSFGDAVKLRTDRAFRSLLAGNVISNVGRVVSETYASGQYRRVVQYKVEAVDTQIGVLLSVEAGGVAPANSTLTIDRVSFGIVAASPKLTQSGTANLERAKLFEDMNANAGLSWQWEPAVISNGWGYFPNGASALPAGAVAPAIAGLKVPAASTGADAYCFNLMTLDAEQVKLMAGSTVRITAKFTATLGALDLLDFQFLAGMRAARGNGASAVVAATLVSMTQEGSVITKVVDYVVDPTDVSWAVSLQVHGSAVAPGQDISVQFKSLTWAVQSVPAGNKRAADVAFLARFQEQIKPTEKSLLVSSANLLDKATVTGSADANGAVLVRDNGIIIGFDIPAGKSGAGVYNRVLLPFDAATRAAIVGKTIRMTLEAEVSATFATDKLLRKDRGVYVEGGIGNAGSLVSEAFVGTRYTRVVEYLVAEGAGLFGPVISYIAGAVSANANSFRLKSVRWQVSEVNAGVSVQDFMIDQRMAAVPKETAQAENYTGAVTVVGTQLETNAVTGFNPMIQAFTVNKLGGLLKTVEQAVAIAAPDTEPVVDHPFTLIAAPSGGAIPGARLPHQYSSNRIVKRVSDGAQLVEGVDYAVKPNTCYLYGLKTIANEPCTISYTGHLHRYDLVSVNLASGALVVTKGTGRAIDPEEYKPVLPAGHVRLNEVYVYPAGVDVLQSWRYRDLRDQLSGQAYDDWLAYCRAKLPKTLAKLRRGQRIRLIGYGSSSVDMGGGALYPLEPNTNRDLASFFDRIPADTRAKYPIYSNSDPDFTWSSQSSHIKYGFVWQLIAAMRERWGADVEYRNWGVGGTTSADTSVNGVPNGAHPDRLNAMLADQGDLMVLAFANGLGADWWYSSHRTIIEAFKAQGGEVIVLTSPRLNLFGEASVDDTIWRKSYDDSTRVALDTGCAYVPTNLIEGPGREGCTGLSHRNMTNANLYNHGGPTQLGNTGKLMAMIIP